MSLEFHALTDPGCVRKENEDRILSDPALGLFAVCDGMGGQNRGELAADLAIAAMRYYIDASRDSLDVTWPFGYDFELSADANRLVTGVNLANRQVWRRAEQQLDCAGMGTTVAALLFNEEQVVIANVGDSRVYRLRANALQQLTVDDSMVASMVQKGLLTAAELRKHPMRNVLTQAAGSQENIQVHVREEVLVSGDLFLITSDGLHGVVEEEAIGSIAGSAGSTEQCAERLVQAARSAGAPDNISVVALRYE